MKNTLLPIILAIGVFAAGAAALLFLPHPEDGGLFGSIGIISPSKISGGLPYAGGPLTKGYTNEAYGFALKMPDDYSARIVADDGSGAQSILLENDAGDGIQIRMTAFPEDTMVLTKERVLEDVPDLAMTDVQEVKIGPEYKGLAFKSDNESFDGSSREVWFVFRGTLYQISTYAQLDSLLQAMFGTWKFY